MAVKREEERNRRSGFYFFRRYNKQPSGLTMPVQPLGAMGKFLAVIEYSYWFYQVSSVIYLVLSIVYGRFDSPVFLSAGVPAKAEF